MFDNVDYDKVGLKYLFALQGTQVQVSPKHASKNKAPIWNCPPRQDNSGKRRFLTDLLQKHVLILVVTSILGAGYVDSGHSDKKLIQEMRPERPMSLLPYFDALAAADEDDVDEDAAASEEYNDNGIQVWSVHDSTKSYECEPCILMLFVPKRKQRRFRPQNGQVARGKTVMIAGHGAFGVENVGNAEVQITERTGFSSIFWWEQQGSLVKGKSNPIHRWWFQTFYFHPCLGKWSNFD